MRTKDHLPLSAFGDRDLSPVLAAYLEINHLKQLYRQGWLHRGIPAERSESVADHIFSMALLAWWIADSYLPELDVNKTIRMVLAHELGEVYVGDLTPSDGVVPQEKHRRERAAVQQVVGKLPRGEEYLALWQEYEQGESPEARFVKQIDRLEMAFQAIIYQRQGFGDLSEFIASAEQVVKDPVLQNLLDELKP